MAKAPAKASAKKQTTLLLAGREVTVTNPDKVYFPTAGHTKLDLVRYYVEVAEGALRGIAGRPIVMKRYVDGADKPAFYQKRAPGAPARLDRDRRAPVPVGADRRGGRRPRRRPADLAGEPRLHRPAPAPGARRRPGPPGRAAHRPGSRPRRRLGRRHPHRAGLPGRAGRTRPAPPGPRRPARAGCTSTSASSGAGASPTCGGRRWRWRARWSGASPPWPPAPGGRRSATACSSTTTRTPRIAPPPAPTPCAPRPTPGCRRRWTGTRWPAATRRRSP